MKMDIYKKRQLTALGILVLIFLIIVMMVRCTIGMSEKKNNQEDSDAEVSSESEPTVNNMDIPELSDMLQSERPSEHNFSELTAIDRAEVEFEAEDISLISEKYMNDVVVVGDSISRGYSVYGRIKDDNVLAEGSIGVRNVLETQFDYQGYKLGITDILGRKKPKYIFISFGMNDLNMKTEEEYTAEFQNFISEVQKATPESVILITAITPISRQTTFTTNEKIDKYNEALHKMVFDYNSDKIYFVNAAQYLKGPDNYLVTEFSSGDGIHLAASAYDYLLTYMLSMLEWI